MRANSGGVIQLADEVTRGRDSNAFDVFRRLSRNELRRVADQDDRALLPRLHGAVG